MAPRDAFRRGAIDVFPVLLGVIPFGLLAGAIPAELGLGLEHAVGLATIVFAGAAQLAAIDLIGESAHVTVIVGTILVINLRMLMYGASIAPYLVDRPLSRRLGAAYILTDQAYALSVARYRGEPMDGRTRLAYYLGAAVPLWVNWQVVVVLGWFVGAAVPESLPIEFAIPLTFLVLLVPSVTDRATVLAALAGGVTAVVLDPLPANAGIPIGALTGIVVGTAVELQARESRTVDA
ncbi:MAG: AzlC family ABC transporter permease [Nitriliruptorales bacterium]|nr:AzlC family ABC transporter permease [Nitriliruptorales bacterium]